MSNVSKVRSVLVGLGLADERLAPHDFESAVHLLYAPAPGPTVASVPNIVTPATSARCVHDGCDRPRSDPIHRPAEA